MISSVPLFGSLTRNSELTRTWPFLSPISIFSPTRFNPLNWAVTTSFSPTFLCLLDGVKNVPVFASPVYWMEHGTMLITSSGVLSSTTTLVGIGDKGTSKLNYSVQVLYCFPSPQHDPSRFVRRIYMRTLSKYNRMSIKITTEFGLGAGHLTNIKVRHSCRVSISGAFQTEKMPTSEAKVWNDEKSMNPYSLYSQFRRPRWLCAA